GLGSGNRLRSTLKVHGLLALDVAVRAAAGREHHGIAPRERGRKVRLGGVFDVELARLGAHRGQVEQLLLLARERHYRVATAGQNGNELESNLPVAANDCNAFFCRTGLWSSHPSTMP